MAKTATSDTAARFCWRCAEFSLGSGQRVSSRTNDVSKFRKLITGINPRVATEVKLLYPRGSTEATANGIWETGSIMLGAGPVQDVAMKCTKSPRLLADAMNYSLLEVTIVVINDGQRTSTDETVEIEIVT